DITGTNDAPTLTDGASVALTGTNEDTTSSGTTVSSILTGAGYSDIDAGASSGIAITGMTGNGKWQYSTDGTNWVDIDSASASAAVLLTSTSQVRYIPDGNNGETANLTFKAWDQTTGSASTTGSVSTADSGTSGGGSAFSSQNASASMVVSNVNDAPTAPASLPGTIIENGGPMSYVVSVAGFNDIDGDNLSFTATLADGSALPAWLSYSVNGSNVTFSGNVPGDFIGDLEVRITATEDATAHLTASSNLTIQVEARPVVVVTPPASPPEPAPVPPVMSPPGTGNIGDAGTPVGSALDFGGRNGGEIVQPVTGQLGSLSPLDNSSTPVMAGLQSTTPPSIFGDTAGQTIFGGDVGAGTGILAGRTQLITSQGAGLGNDAGFEPANGNGEGTGTDEGAAGTPNLDGAAQNGGGDNGNASNGNGSADAEAGNAPNDAAQPDRAAPADAQNNGESDASPASENPGGDGDVAPEGNDNIQGALDNLALPSFVFKEAVLANADFTDQLAGAGGAFERHASALAKALSDFDASAA
ncbi:putative Ig domain-containing protein, partial [Thalassospira marina]